MRYSLRTLLILTILGPPGLAALWWAVRRATLVEIAAMAAVMGEMLLALGPIVAVAYLLSLVAKAIVRR